MDKSQLQIIITAIDQASEQLALISDSFKRLGDVATEANAQLAEGSKAAASSMEGVTSAATGESAALERLQTLSVQQASIARQQLDATNAQTAAIEKQTGVIDTHNQSQRKIATGAAVMAVGVGYAIDKTVKSYADLQSAVTRLVTSAGESTSNLAMVTAGIQSTARATGTSTGDLAQAMYTIESAGFHGAAGLKLLTAAAKGAKDENAQVGDVANAASTIINAYGKKNIDATQAVNGMITAVSRGKTTLQLFSTSLATVLPIAASAHISFAQIAGAISTMTAQGMTAQNATQNLRNAIQHLQAPTAIQITQMQQMGLDVEDLTTKLGERGLVGTEKLVVQAVQEHTKAGKVYIDAMMKSKSATDDAKAAIAAMPKSMRAVAQGYLDGSISAKDFRTDLYAMTPLQRNLGNQFATIANKAHGFSTELKTGSPIVTSYDAELAKVTGSQSGLQVALMLSGQHASTFNDNVNAVSKSLHSNSKEILGWTDMQGTFNQRMSEMKQDFVTTGQEIGKVFIPILVVAAKTLALMFAPLAALINKYPVLAAVVLGAVGAFATFIVTMLAIKKVTGWVGDATKEFKGLMSTFNIFDRGAKEAGKFGGALKEVQKSTEEMSKISGNVGKGIGNFIENIFKPLGSTAVLRGAASAVLIGVAIAAIAYGINEASKAKVSLGNLAVLMTATVVIAAIMALLGTFGTYAAVGAIASAVIGVGLYIAATGISKASDLSATISIVNLLKLSTALATVSAALALTVGWSAFASIASLFDAVIAKGILIAARGLSEASKAADTIKGQSFDNLKDVIKKLSDMSTGGILKNLGQAWASSSLADTAKNLVTISEDLGKVQPVKPEAIKSVQDILTNLGHVHTENFLSAWNTKSSSGSILETVQNIYSISDILTKIKPVDPVKMDLIAQMFLEAGKIHGENFIRAWGDANSSKKIADTTQNILTVSDNLNKIKVVDPSKMDLIAQMFLEASHIHGDSFMKAWGESNSSKKLVDSVKNILTISQYLEKVHTPKGIMKTLNDLQAAINKAGSMKFIIKPATSSDLQAMSAQGMSLASSFVNGIKKIFDMAKNAGHKLQSSLWSGIQEHMADERNQGGAIVKQIVSGIEKEGSTVQNAGHTVQARLWAGIQNHFKDEYDQGRSLIGQVLNGIYSMQNQWWSAGDSVAIGFAGGISRNMWQVNKAAGQLSGTVITKMKDLLGIHSPSTVFAEIGQNIDAGLQQGITGNKNAATNAATELGTSTVQVARQAAVSANSAPVPNINTRTGQPTGGGGVGGGVHIYFQSPAFMGNQANATQFATQVYQSLQKISRQHGLQSNLPNIGIRPI